MLKSLVKASVSAAGFQIVRIGQPAPAPVKSEPFRKLDLSDDDEQIFLSVKSFTMTSKERIAALIDSVRYIARNQIPGDVVECGVWRGGSSMAAALTLLSESDSARDIWLYDTFEGMSEPCAKDVDHNGNSAQSLLAADRERKGNVWAKAGFSDVQANMKRTSYPFRRIHMVAGKVENSIPAYLPKQIAFLRLDTDWYESTLHELNHLYPLLAVGGVLVIDDYGHWKGARAAVDEYFASVGHSPLLQRIDYTGRLHIKVHQGNLP